jgi:cobalt/nickel transport system ATP-binding protein
VTLALVVDGLSFHWVDGTVALDGVSFSVSEGERVALVGPNGAGKSTLLLHLNGVLQEEARGHSSGTVTVLGDAIAARTAVATRRRVGLLFQDPDDQLFCPTVGEDVAFGPGQLDLAEVAVRERVTSALTSVGLAGFERRQPHQLSGGEKKRVGLAGLLAVEPPILVLDEPTSGLDPRARRQFIDLLARQPATQIIATHDLALVAELCDRMLVLDGGRIVVDGPTFTLLKDDTLMEAHGLGRPSRDLPAHLLEART